MSGRAANVAAPNGPNADTNAAARLRAAAAIGRLPLDFERNEGQASADVKFTSRLGAVSVSFLPDRMEFAASGAAATALSLRLVGAKSSVTMAATEPLAGRSNFVIGNDPKAWRLGVQQFQRLRYSDVYDGIDIDYYGSREHLEHDFLVSPGGHPADIVIEVGGAQEVSISDAGNVRLKTASGVVSLQCPDVYQVVGGKRRVVTGGYVLRGNRLSFNVGAYDHSQTLVIDPVILFDDVLGGNSLTQANGVAVDLTGNIFVTGYTQATNYPVVNAAQGTCSAGCGNSDAFLTKLDPIGATTLYSTYFGGSGIDQGLAVTTDQIGNAYITGTTTSSDFPTKNAFQSSAVDAPNGTVFVAKFDPNGVLIYSSYLGGSNYEDFSSNYDGAIAVDTSGSAYVVGSTGSTDFPLKNAYQGTLLGRVNAFLTKFSLSGSSLVFSTYLGGKSTDGAFGVAVDSTGAAYVTGTTGSTNFPTTAGALSTVCAACSNFSSEAFVTKFKPDGSGLVYSTFLGDAGGSVATGIAIDSNLDAYVSGNTTSKTFPVKGTLQQACVSCADNQNSGFISELNPAGSALVYSNFIGGHGQTYANAIALDSSGTAYVAGSTDAPDFPTTALPPQGLGGLGIDSSTDSGTTIVKNNQGLASAQINAIVADASNPGTVYAATLNGVFKSLDGGVTWTAMNSGLPAGPSGKPVANIQSIAVQPSSGKVLAGVLSKGVYASVNGGTSWTASSTGFPSPFSGSVGAIAFDSSNPTTVYVGIGNAITLLKSVNSGANWTRSDTGLPAGDNFFVSKGIIVDPRNSNNVYFSATEQFGSSKGLFASTNGAATWNAINTGLPTLTINSIAMDPASSTTLYAGTGTSFSPDGGVFKTVDSGAHWALSLDAGSWATSSLAIDPLTERVYAGLSGAGMLYSTDSGASWNTSNVVYSNVSAIALDQGTGSAQFFGLSPLSGTIGGSSSFLSNFSADGSSLVLSTYSGGVYYNQALGVVVDAITLVGDKIGPAMPQNIQNTVPTDTVNTNQGDVTEIGTPPVGNLTVSKMVDKTAASLGDTLNYTITVTNLGPGPAATPTATDSLPGNLDQTTFTKVPIVGGTVALFGSTVICKWPFYGSVIQAGESVVCSFGVKADGAGDVVNEVIVPTGSTQITAVARTTVSFPGSPTFTPATGNLGQISDGKSVIGTFVVTNSDPTLNYHQSSASVSCSPNATCTTAVSCPTVSAGTMCTGTIAAACNTTGAFTGTETLNDNTATGATLYAFSGTCAPSADLSVTKTVDKPSASPGDELTYTITIKNAGPDTATGVNATDTIPDNLDINTGGLLDTNLSTIKFQSFRFPQRTVVCGEGLLTIPAGQSAFCKFSIKIKGPIGYAVNTVSLTSDTVDPNITDNSETVTTEIVARPQTTWGVSKDGTVGVSLPGNAGQYVTPLVTPPGSASGLAFDNTGNIWVAASTAVLEYNSTGILLSTTPFTGGGLGGPGNNTAGIAIDGDGKIWVANSIGSVTLLSSSGVALSPSTGFTTSLSAPSGVAIDNAGTVWITNSGNNSVTRVFGAAAPAVTPLSSANYTGTFGARP